MFAKDYSKVSIEFYVKETNSGLMIVETVGMSM
jgi:hypothetical protein